MILVASPHPQNIASLSDEIGNRTLRTLVTIDRGPMAARILALNPIAWVLIDLRGAPTRWIHTFGQLPPVRAAVLGTGPADVTDAQQCLPDNTTYVFEPVDWDRLVEQLEERGAEETQELVAAGLSDVADVRRFVPVLIAEDRAIAAEDWERRRREIDQRLAVARR